MRHVALELWEAGKFYVISVRVRKIEFPPGSSVSTFGYFSVCLHLGLRGGNRTSEHKPAVQVGTERIASVLILEDLTSLDAYPLSYLPTHNVFP